MHNKFLKNLDRFSGAPFFYDQIYRAFVQN